MAKVLGLLKYWVFKKSARIVPTFILISPILAGTGCGGRLFEVTRQKPPDPPTITAEECLKEQNTKNGLCSVPGIPFYTVNHRCVHTTSWLQPIYAVTFTVTSEESGFMPQARTVFLGQNEFNSTAVRAQLAAFKAKTETDDYQAVFQAFSDFADANGINPLSFDETKLGTPGTKETTEAILSSNAVTSEKYIDTRALYYYNVKKPREGTANAEIDLNDDGVISKASGQVEDKLLSTVLSALPISDLIKGAAGFTPANVTPQKGKYKLSLDLQTTIYRHTHALPLSSAPPCLPDSSVVAGASPFNWTVEDATITPKPADSKDTTAKPKTQKDK